MVVILISSSFSATMRIVDEIPNFRGWVGKLLSVAPMDGRSWKNLSHRFGWKVKTHGKCFFPLYSLHFCLLLSLEITLTLLVVRVSYSRHKF